MKSLPHAKSSLILYKIENSLIDFCVDFSRLIEKSLSETLNNLSHILGYGLGSTPESDDIFLGVLIALYCMNPTLKKEFEFLSVLPFERYTTAKSAQLIRRILKQHFPPEIIPFIELLKNSFRGNHRKSSFEQEIRKIRALGASSGYYFLIGVLWELKFLSKNEK